MIPEGSYDMGGHLGIRLGCLIDPSFPQHDNDGLVTCNVHKILSCNNILFPGVGED